MSFGALLYALPTLPPSPVTGLPGARVDAEAALSALERLQADKARRPSAPWPRADRRSRATRHRMKLARRM